MLNLSSGRFVLSGAAIVFSCVASLVAQAPRTERPQPASQNAGANKSDAALATCLIIDNRGEIALAEFAQQRAQSEDVKQFAQRMADEHTQFISKLAPFAGGEVGRPEGANRTREGANRAAPADARPNEAGAAVEDTDRQRRNEDASDRNADRQNADRENNAAADQPRTQRNASQPRNTAGGAVDFLAIKQELGEKCLQTAQRELGKKEGAEFDKCYMTQQVMAHLHMVDTLEVFQNHVSGDLKQVLQEGLQTAQAHLKHAEDLAKQSEAALLTQTERRN
jgi:predicted outer membrane protein